MNRPFVLINMAMTADGKIATANRAVSSFGGRRDKEHLLELRATAHAVMAGARTVDSAPVVLGPGPARYRRIRLQSKLPEYNLRVIVSGSGTINPRARIFTTHTSPVIVLTTGRAGERRLKALRALAHEVKIFGAREINFHWAFEWLHRKWRVRRLVCEGGGQLNDALIRARVVDEVHVTVCPKIFGGRAAPTIADGIGHGSLNKAARFELKSARRIGDEMFLVYRASRGK